MAKQVQAVSLLLVMAICTVTLFRVTVAQLPLPPIFPGGGGLPLPPIFPSGGGLPLPPIFPGGSGVADVIKCWASLTNVHGCAQEIIGSLASGQIGRIGPNCCNAINGITKDCWAKMFPMIPLFPPLLKNSCVGVSAAPIEESKTPN